MPIVDKDINSIEELVSEVLSVARALAPGRFLWFRGHNCSYYTLSPKLLRDGKPFEQVYEREQRLITRFRQRSMPYWPAGYPQNDWEQLFAMQHYGMPTRLLDWSENLFVSVHFALEGYSQEFHNHSNPCNPVLWCIDPIEWNRSSPAASDYGEVIHVLTTADEVLENYQPTTSKRRKKTPLAMYGAHNSNRIVAQEGTFMVWGYDTRSLEDLSNDQPSQIWKFNLKGDREEFSRSLRSLGFSETMVYPEMQSLSIELSRSEGWR